MAVSKAQKEAQARWVAKQGPAHAANKREYMRKWRERNREYIREYMDVWRHFNGGRIASYNISYQRAVKQQTPAWADMDRINDYYNEAKARGETVDHIIPLRGDRVSGLHVDSNLQIIPHSLNASKGNKFQVAA